MIRLAILGFGKVGQKLVRTVLRDSAFNSKFKLAGIWNRSLDKLKDHPDLKGIPIYNSLSDLLHDAASFDLVVECAHPDIFREFGPKLISESNIFMSSPSILGFDDFKLVFEKALSDSSNNCYLPIGASIGIWDIIKLDQQNRLQELSVTMTKHPDSFKIDHPEIRYRLDLARTSGKAVRLIEDSIDIINRLAPQNTNTMSIFNLGASHLSKKEKKGILVADPNIDTHIVQLHAVTSGGLELKLERINPAGHGAVTGNATFDSFTSSLLHFDIGIPHNSYIFC